MPVKRPWRCRLWPYYILQRDDVGLIEDLRNIIDHFERIGFSPELVVFVPQAGCHLQKLFRTAYSDRFATGTFTVRRASSTKPPHAIRRLAYRVQVLADMFRHLQVLPRLLKLKMGWSQKREIKGGIDADVIGKRILVIDDSVDTGTTMRIICERLMQEGAREVRTGCISNHLSPRVVAVDFAVYEYALLRSPTSPDYHAR